MRQRVAAAGLIGINPTAGFELLVERAGLDLDSRVIDRELLEEQAAEVNQDIVLSANVVRLDVSTERNES